MDEFIAKHREEVIGTLSGFDRLVFRGTLRSIAFPDGFSHYLHKSAILLKHYAAHVKQVSARLKRASLAVAEALKRPIEYLTSSKVSKEELAKEIAARDEIRQGLICVLSAVEPCWTFEIHRNRERQMLELVSRQRKCLFLYHYWMDPMFGLMNARIQTWFPFAIQVCLNGREWLARQMDAHGIRYVAQGNCFPWVEDWTEAQRLMNQQLRSDWPTILDRIAGQLNPIHDTIFSQHPVRYYWSTYQHEWAIDVVFRDPAYLHRLYPRLIHHGMANMGSSDVMRYLGKRLLKSGEIPSNFSGEVVSTLKEREEGVRIKHAVNGNSGKLYDKAYTELGSVLRGEITFQNTKDLRAYRAKEGDPDGPKSWRPMRRGIADLHRRAELSEKAAERYLDAYAAADEDTTLEELLAKLKKSTVWGNRRVRALRPLDEDRDLLSAVARGEFTFTGFRNRDLQRLLFSSPPDSPAEARRRSAWISRKLRLLRAHSLITKIHGTHRYQLNDSGHKTITAILTALGSTVRQLTALAA
ncbi:MAG: hypothetical protein ABI779_27210 [Acidobacteriota bacterium]